MARAERLDRLLTASHSAATICCVPHWPSRARSEAGFTGLLSTAIFSSRAATCTAGLRSAVAHDHYSLLHTIEDGFGVPCLASSCDANTLGEFFRG